MKRINIVIITAIVSILLISYIGISLYSHNKKVDFKNFYTENNSVSDLDYVTLEDIKNEKDSVLEKLYSGHYENLSGENVMVSLSDSRSVGEIKEYCYEVYHGITNVKEMYEQQMDTIQYFLGEDLDNRFLVDSNASAMKPKNNGEYGKISDMFYTNEEIIGYIQDGTYTDVFGGLPDMNYIGFSAASEGESEDDKRYCGTGMGYYMYVPVIKGKYLEIQETFEEDPVYELDSIAEYYTDRDSLLDIYELDNGSISIDEAVNFVENYWEKCIPYDTDKNVKKKVIKVNVFQMRNGKHCLRFETTREFMGLKFEYGEPVSNNGAMPSSEPDHGVEVMVDVDDIDELLGGGNGYKVELTGEPSDRMVSMESAVDKISDTIGNNSKYDIESIEMVYRRKIVTLVHEFKGIPCWKVRSRNLNNDTLTVFYVNLLDGQVSYETE